MKCYNISLKNVLLYSIVQSKISWKHEIFGEVYWNLEIYFKKSHFYVWHQDVVSLSLPGGQDMNIFFQSFLIFLYFFSFFVKFPYEFSSSFWSSGWGLPHRGGSWQRHFVTPWLTSSSDSLWGTQKQLVTSTIPWMLVPGIKENNEIK